MAPEVEFFGEFVPFGLVESILLSEESPRMSLQQDCIMMSMDLTSWVDKCPRRGSVIDKRV